MRARGGADGEITEDELADWFRERVERIWQRRHGLENG